MHKHIDMGDKIIYMNKIFALTSAAIIAMFVIAFSPKSYAPHAYGIFSPTVTDITNATGSTAAGAGSYMRIGNTVTFSIELSVSPTAGLSSTQVDITLPVASAIANTYELSGTCSGTRGRVVGQVANDRASVIFVSDVSGTETITVHATYRIL